MECRRRPHAGNGRHCTRGIESRRFDRVKLTGWDVARHAREIDAGFPVVYMTGANADDWASKGVPNSILLSKPFAQAQLLTAVSQLLNADSQTV